MFWRDDVILMQFRNHEIGVDLCYLNTAFKLDKWFRTYIIEISVTEYIQWNMNTVRDL